MDRAKNAVLVTMKLAVLLYIAFVLLLAFGHDVWASLFSRSAAIVSAFAGITPLMVVSTMFETTQSVLSGVSRGCGWQHLAALTNLVAYYFVAMPLVLLFAFFLNKFLFAFKLKFYAKGLWVGLICGLAC